MTWEKELQTAKGAALTAGHFLKKNKDLSCQQEATTTRDVKLKADQKSEAIILDILSADSQYPVLAEESGETGSISKAELMWIVDPLDGTVNYSRDVHLCCVSIALYKGFTPILGVIYDFNNDELFSGAEKNGATCNGQNIHTSGINKTSHAILATGFPVNRNFDSAPLQTFLDQVQQFKKLRLFGSAALSLAYVACGRIDAYMEEDIMFWDVAAGLAIARAAGAFTSLRETGNRTWAMLAQAGSDDKLFAKDSSNPKY